MQRRSGRSRPRLALALRVALACGVAGGLFGCGSEEASEATAAQQAAESPEAGDAAESPEALAAREREEREAARKALEAAPRPNLPTQPPEAKRLVEEGCEPAIAALQYEDLVGKRAVAILAWTGMPQKAADLRIPVYVIGVEEERIDVRVLEIPNREQYLTVWLASGHLESGPFNVFRLDPCSARLEPATARASGPPAG